MVALMHVHKTRKLAAHPGVVVQSSFSIQELHGSGESVKKNTENNIIRKRNDPEEIKLT